ncbi:MAG TPA: hypothetical protein VG497_31585, partial [Kribbella sp.]|nr:hypothetical protein [Kribbella sp.]
MTNLVQLIPREPFGREELERYAEKNGWTRAESFADWLRDDLPLHSDDSLCRLVESTRDDMALMDALRRLGVSRAGQQF